MQNISLVMFKADGARRDFPIAGKRMIIGRKNNCDLRIPLSSVSRQHCEIRLDKSKLNLRDLGSSNGTFHNDTRVQEAVLVAGDEIVVGPVVFTVVVDGEPSEIQPVRTIISQEANANEESAVLGAAGNDESAELTHANAQAVPLDEVKPKAGTSTVDLDDPIAALEALAQAEDDDEDDEGPTGLVEISTP